MQNKIFIVDVDDIAKHHDDDVNVIMKNIDDSSSITSMKDNKTNKNVKNSHNHNQSTLSSMRKLSMFPIDVGATAATLATTTEGSNSGTNNPNNSHVVNQLSISSHSTCHLLSELLEDEKEDAINATYRKNIKNIQQQQTNQNNTINNTKKNTNQKTDDESSSFISKLIRQSNSKDDFYNDDDTIDSDQYVLLTSGGDGGADDNPIMGVLSKPSLPPKEIFGGIDLAQEQPEGVSSSIGFKYSNRISPIECDQVAHDDTSSICTIPITAHHQNCSDQEEVALNGGFVSNSSICSSVLSTSSHSGDGRSGKSLLLSAPTVCSAITPIKSNRKRRSLGDFGDSQEEQEGHKKMKRSPRTTNTIASYSKKKASKLKESIGYNSNSLLQDEEEHRSFVSAIFNIGLQHSSPLSLFETMSDKCQHQLPEGLNLERIKSKLQKYRNKKEQSKEEFMTLYDQTMDYFMRAKTISFSKQMEEVEGEQGGKARKEKNKNHKIIQRQPCMQSLNASEIAAFLSFSILKEEGKCTVPYSNESRNDLDSISPSSILNSVNYEGHDTLIMPELTEAERSSPIGRAFDNFMTLFEATRASFQMSTQFKYTPHMPTAYAKSSIADAQKLDTKVASSAFISSTGSWFPTDNRVLNDTSRMKTQSAQPSNSDNDNNESLSKMRYISHSLRASMSSSSKKMQQQQLSLGPPSTITTKTGIGIQPNNDQGPSYSGNIDQYIHQDWYNSPYYFLNQTSRYPHAANHPVWNMHPNMLHTNSKNGSGKSFSRNTIKGQQHNHKTLSSSCSHQDETSIFLNN